MRAIALGLSSPMLVAFSHHSPGNGVATAVHEPGSRPGRPSDDHGSCLHGAWSIRVPRPLRSSSPARPAPAADRRGAGKHDSVRLAADPRSVSAARIFARSRLAEWHMHPLDDTLSLLVSELVTNAIVHVPAPHCDGPRHVQVALAHTSRSVLVEVTDEGRKLPCTRAAQEDEEGGRGLWLVEQLSDTWGIRPETHGKTVWFTLSLADAPDVYDLPHDEA